MATLVGAAISAWMVSGLPVPWAPWETRYDDARAIQLAALIGLMFALSVHPLPLISAWRRVPVWARITGALCGLCGLISAAQSRYPVYALVDHATLTALVIASLSLGSGTVSSTRRTQVAIVLWMGAFTLGWRLLAELAAVVITSDASALRYSWFMFINPRYFAKAATWLLPVFWLGYVLFQRRWKALSVAAVALAGLVAAHLFMSGSRGALWAMLISVAVCALAFGSPGRRIALAHLLYLTVGCALWAVVEWVYGGASFSHIARSGSSGRDVLIREGFVHVTEAPWFGIGPMQFAAIDAHSAAAAPHNAVIQLASEWGVPAALSLVALTLMWLRWSARCIRAGIARGDADIDVYWNIAMFAAILTALGQSLVANVLTDPISQTLLVLCMGIASQARADHDDAAPAPTLRWTQSVVVRGLILVIAAVLCIALVQGSRCVGTHTPMEYMPGADGRIWPRYWSQGYIPLEQTCHSVRE